MQKTALNLAVLQQELGADLSILRRSQGAQEEEEEEGEEEQEQEQEQERKTALPSRSEQQHSMFIACSEVQCTASAAPDASPGVGIGHALP